VRVVVVVFAGGHMSHPLHKQHAVVRTRKDEATEVHKVLGVAESVFLMLQDASLRQEIVEKEIMSKLHDLIKKEKPTKIFMPALEDLPPDHRAVSRTMLQLYSQYKLECALYSYTIWNPLAILKRSQPRLVVDISEQQHKKFEAYRLYKSQWVSLYQLVPIVTIKSFLAGMRYGCRWAEVFIQVR
jgi:LmbE family N-acetylglucosaminyl deacetylase